MHVSKPFELTAELLWRGLQKVIPVTKTATMVCFGHCQDGDTAPRQVTTCTIAAETETNMVQCNV